MKVCYAYPGLSPHIREVASAFQDASAELDLYTTAVARADRAWERAAVGRFAEVWPRARDHVFAVGPRTRFHRQPIWDFLRAAGDRLAWPATSDRLWEVKSREFDRWVAAELRPGTDAVIGYEHSCLRTFRRARRLGVTAIYHMLAPHHDVSHAVLAAQAARYPSLSSARGRPSMDTERRREWHKNLEYAAADRFVANSTYTAGSVIARGVPAGRVAVVPLGGPPADPGWRAVPRGGPVRFLFAGSLSLRKGVPQLLRVWRDARPGDAVLWLAGRWGFDPPPEWRHLPGVVELGNLSHKALFQKYREADVLVFPTLCDGFGMVVTEALANGLPVVTTTSAGAADLVRDGETGWVIPPADEGALARALAGCAADPGRVRGMREAAMAAAARPWAAYRREFVAAVRGLVNQTR